MPRTALTVQTLKGPYPVEPVAADSLDLTWTAADVANGNDFALSGREILLVRNVSTTTARTFTITSIADTFNRLADVTAYSLNFGTPIGETAAFSFFNGLVGWLQSDNKVWLAASNADIQYAVIKF